MLGRWIVPFGVASLLLAGCAETSDVVVAPAGPAGIATPSPTAGPGDELTAALEEWKDFPAGADQRPLIILRETSGGGFKTSDAKMAYGGGSWSTPKELPPTPKEFGGYPVIGAAEALEVLRGEERGAEKEGDGIEVERVRLTTSTFPTDRGTLELPAWRVDFDGGTLPFFVVAVADSARYVPDPRTPFYSFGGVIGTESDTELMVSHGGSADDPGPCGADYRIETAESDNAVAFRVVTVERPEAETTNDTVACDAMLHGRSTPMTLDAPLGKRVLLMAGADRAVPTPLIAPEKTASG
jgi:hypothetical protein